MSRAIRAAALVLLAGLAAAAAAQTPRYEGVRLEAAVTESPSWTGGARGGRPCSALCPPGWRDASASGTDAANGAPPARPGLPPLAPPVQGEDWFGDIEPDTTTKPDAWLGRDKAFHAGGSFLLVLSGQYLLVNKHGLSEGRALPVSAATVLALGLVKEVADSRRERDPLFSWRDLAADAAGVALAALVVGL